MTITRNRRRILVGTAAVLALGMGGTALAAGSAGPTPSANECPANKLRQIWDGATAPTAARARSSSRTTSSTCSTPARS